MSGLDAPLTPAPGSYLKTYGASVSNFESTGSQDGGGRTVASGLVRQAGLPIGLFDQEKVLLTTDEFFALYNAIPEISRDPAIGLKLGTDDRIELYDPICIAALCSGSFRDALKRLGRYKQLTCPEEIALVERGEECAVRFNWLLAEEEELVVLVDACFAWIMTIARRGTGRPIHPKRVEFQRPEVHRRVYEKHFQFRVPVIIGHDITGNYDDVVSSVAADWPDPHGLLDSTSYCAEMLF